MKKQILTTKDTEKIASLANLSLKNEEIEKFTSQLSAILEYVEKLQQVNTSSISETSQVTGLINITRPDITDSSRTIRKGKHFSVDAIFE